VKYIVIVAMLLLVVPAFAATITVNVGPGLVFSPSSVSITTGDTVQWHFNEFGHTTTSNATSGTDAWNSGVVASGGNFTHTFSNTGDFPYYCAVHSSASGSAMNGTVHVAAPLPPPPPAAVVPALNGTLLVVLAGILMVIGVFVITRRG